MTTLLPFAPRVTGGVVDTPRCYDYSPSSVNSRLFWTCGLGTDTIVSYRAGQVPTPPFFIEGKLVADPAALRTATGYVVYFTIGNKDGTRNGIGVLKTDAVGRVINWRTVIPQSTREGTYGTGQPSVAALPGNKYLLVCREDGPSGESLMGAYIIDSRDPWRVLHPIRFAMQEDGASPEAFFYRGKLHILIVASDPNGDGYAGIRTYNISEDLTQLWRETWREGAWPVGEDGAMFRAVVTAPIKNVLDGAGVIRNINNDPIVSRGCIQYWRGWRPSPSSMDWKLVKEWIELPA